jgi:hypothetical protein
MNVRLGQTWQRKSPAGDQWDRVCVRGYSERAEAESEWVIQPLTGFESIGLLAPDLEAVFELESEPPDAPPSELGVDSLHEWVC